MKKTALLLVLGLFLTASSAQNFIRAYSNLPFSSLPGLIIPEECIQLPNGNFLMTGFTGFILLTDPQGEPISTMTVSRTNPPNFQRINLDGLAYAGSNQFYLGGALNADSLFFLRLDFTTGMVWQTGYHLPGNFFADMIATQDGGLLAMASTNRGTTQSAIPVLTKIASDGSLQWQKRYFNGNPAQGRIRWNNVTQAANGDFLLAGVSNETTQRTAHIARLQPDGELVWAKSFQPANNNNEEAACLQEMANGNLRLVMDSPVPGAQLATATLTANGDWISGVSWSGMGFTSASCASLPDGKLAVALQNAGRIMFVDNSDALLFAEEYTLPGGGVLLSERVLFTQDGNMAYYGGYTVSFFGDFILSLFKTSLTGQVPPGFSTPFSPTSSPFTPALTAATLVDSAGGSLYPLTLSANTITQLYDTLYIEHSLSLGRSLDLLPLQLAPNPASNLVTITAPEPGGTLEVFDLQGRVWKKTSVPGYEYSLETASWPAGSYWVLWKGRDGRQAGELLLKP